MSLYTPKVSAAEIARAVDLLASLNTAGVMVRRTRRSLELSATPTDALHGLIRREFRGLMFVVRCREESERVLRRFTRAQAWHTEIRVQAYRRRQLEARA